MKYRAAVLRSYETPFAVEEIVLSTGPAAGEILVEIAGCGMCRTDLAVRRSAAAHRCRRSSDTREPESWWRRAMARTARSASVTTSC